MVDTAAKISASGPATASTRGKPIKPVLAKMMPN